MQPMTRAEFMHEINHMVDTAIADDMVAHGTDKFIEESILDELENVQMPETTGNILVGLLVVFGIRRRMYLAEHPAH